MKRSVRGGDLLRLRNGALPGARVREFTFVGVDGNRVVLAHKDGSYEWATDIDNIDWKDYHVPKAA